jgi:hypothetical protein
MKLYQNIILLIFIFNFGCSTHEKIEDSPKGEKYKLENPTMEEYFQRLVYQAYK